MRRDNTGPETPFQYQSMWIYTSALMSCHQKLYRVFRISIDLQLEESIKESRDWQEFYNLYIHMACDGRIWRNAGKRSKTKRFNGGSNIFHTKEHKDTAGTSRVFLSSSFSASLAFGRLPLTECLSPEVHKTYVHYFQYLVLDFGDTNQVYPVLENLLPLQKLRDSWKIIRRTKQTTSEDSRLWQPLMPPRQSKYKS